jgi:hypothetical protein
MQGTFRPTSLYSYDTFNNVTAYCDPVATHANLHADWTAQPPPSDTLCPQTTVAHRFIWSNPPSGTVTNPTPSYEPFGQLLAAIEPATPSAPGGYGTTFRYDLAPQQGVDYGLPTAVIGDAFTEGQRPEKCVKAPVLV